MKKKNRFLKLLSSLLVLILTISQMFSRNVVLAVNPQETIHNIGTHHFLQSLDGRDWPTPLYNTADYAPSYCMEATLSSVGTTGVIHDNLDINAYFSAEQVEGIEIILTWGYPLNANSDFFATYGLNAEQAQVATAEAIHLYLAAKGCTHSESNGEFAPYFKDGVPNIKAKAGYENVYNCMMALYNKGMNKERIAHTVTLTPVKTMVEEGGNWVCEYNVTAQNCSGGWEVKSISGVSGATYNATANYLTVTIPMTDENYEKTMTVTVMGNDHRTAASYGLFDVSGGGTNYQSLVVLRPVVAKFDGGEISATTPTQTGDVFIQKIDADTGEAIANVSFDIFSDAACQNKVGSVTTDANGCGTCAGLTVGTYYVVETSVPEPYILDTSVHEITVTKDGGSVTIENEKKKGKIAIKKVDADNNEPIGNVTFGIYTDSACLNLACKVTTNANGTGTSIDLQEGTYYVKELEAPEIYMISDEVTEVTLVAGEEAVIKRTNKKAPAKIKIVKVGEDDGKRTPIADVIFEVYSDAALTNKVDTLTTDIDGCAETIDLMPGTYYIKEKYAPVEWILSNEVYKVTLPGGVDIEKKISNKSAKAPISITKTEHETGRAIANVVFEIFSDVNLSTVVDTMTTDANGRATSSDLLPGTYYVKEKSAPSDYVIRKDVLQCTIANGVTGFLNVTNDKAKARIRLAKLDAETGELITKNETKFKIKDMRTGQYLTLDGKNEFVTDANGYVSFIEEIPAGEYLLEETDAPYGYVKAAPVEFDINQKGVQEMADGETKALSPDNDGFYVVSMKDDRIKGILKVQKTGDVLSGAKEYESVYGTFKRMTFESGHLSGIKFDVYNEKDEFIETIITDEDGVATSSPLDLGKYYIVETNMPSGLTDDVKRYEVEVEHKEDLVTPIYEIPVEVHNEVCSTEINIYKEGEILDIMKGTYSFGKKPLEGVVFGVYADQDIKNIHGEVCIKKDDCIGYLVTNAEGKASMKESLVNGKYYYKELKTLPGYILDEEKKPFTLELGNDAVEVVEVNKENPDVNQLYKTKIQLFKVDKANHEITLSNVVFELYNEEDQLMGTFTTDEEGKIVVDGLPLGNYYFKEVKAKDGYILDDSAIAIVVNGEANDSMDITFENEEAPKLGMVDSGNLLMLLLTVLCICLSVCMMRCDYMYSKCKKCADEHKVYKDAEEQGLLLRLPCKVGDTVWYIDDDDDDYPLELLVTKIEVEENDYLRYHAREKDNCGKIGFIKDDIDKTVFLTKEEAEEQIFQGK